MSIKVLNIIFLFVTITFSSYLIQPKPSKKNKFSIVPDSITAYKIADVILSRHYDTSTLNRQKPFKVYLEADSLWIISGVTHKSYSPCPGCCCVEMIICKQDARVVKMIHGE